MQDMNAGHVNVGHENTGHENAGPIVVYPREITATH